MAEITISDGLLHVKSPPPEIQREVEEFDLQSFDPFIFPEARTATEKLRQELRLVEHRRSPTIQMSETDKILFRAVDTGDLSAFLDFCKEGTAIVARDSEGKTILHHAVIYHRLNILSHILLHDLGLDSNQVDSIGRSALHFAAFSKTPEDQLPDTERSAVVSIASLLIGDPRVEVDLKDRKGRTPLSIAARAGLYSVTNMLLSRGANPNLANDEGRTPLHLACLQGHVKAVEALLESNAWIETADRTGFRAIHFAAHGNHFEVVRLLERYGANLVSPSLSGKVPITLTTNQDIKWLLEARKTSQTDPFEIDWVSHPALGKTKLGMSMCPGRNEGNWRRSFDLDIAVMKQQKVELVITTLTPHELEGMGMVQLTKRFQQAGFEAIWFPIDPWIPSDVTSLVQIVTSLLPKIQSEEGTNILVHCNGRRGRMGLFVVVVLIALGVDQDQALKIVRNVRPGMLTNPAHLVYISAFASSFNQPEEPTFAQSFSNLLNDLF